MTFVLIQTNIFRINRHVIGEQCVERDATAFTQMLSGITGLYRTGVPWSFLQ
ncbi:hypothetical protein [Xenorhabdus sp. TH1]|uniref:hypothetical protein n=1 Tax=Xenorhabdus sp. TH1 TaxID=3130166 RepID=UPI0030D60F0F